MALPITPELIERTGEALRAGGWRYTPRQLYYAACAAVETPPARSPANTEMALGVVLILLGLILVGVRIAFIALVTLGGLLVLAGAAARLMRRPPPPGRLLAVSFAAFERELATASPPALIDVAAWSPAPAAAGVTIVCDTVETAAAIDANRAAAGLGDVAVRAGAGHQALTGVAAVAIHDASPRGCALPLELRDAGADVFDAGLRPAWVDSLSFQTLEGAPARLPRDLSGALTDDEIAWLASGRRVELAVLPPERLMRLVTAALQQKRKAHPDAPDTAAPGLLPSLPDLP